MNWWVKALIVTAFWLGLTVAAATVHHMVPHGKSTPQQERAIGEKYGEAAVKGMILIWIVELLLRNKGTNEGQTGQSKRFNTQSSLSLVAGIMISLISSVASQQREFVPVAVLVGLVGWALIIWGTVNYARWKGYSGWFGLFGYLLVVGLGVLACFPNRRKQLDRKSVV